MHRLERSVEYVTNKDKTVRPRPDSASSLQEAVDYTRNREKTECDVFESAIGCTLETAFEDMLANKKRWNQIDGVQGYHLVQSFAEGELTPGAGAPDRAGIGGKAALREISRRHCDAS